MPRKAEGSGRLTASLEIDEWMEGNIRERIEEKLVNLLAEKIDRQMDELIGRRLTELADKEFNRLAKQKVEEFFSKACKRTNNYGEEVGESITMRQLLLDRCEKHLTEKVNAKGETDGYRSDRTRLQWIIDTLAYAPLEAAVAETVKKISDQAKVAIQSSVSRYIAEQLSPTISVPQLTK